MSDNKEINQEYLDKLDYRVRTGKAELEFETRKISDYYYVYDRLLFVCKKLGIPFKDIDQVATDRAFQLKYGKKCKNTFLEE